MIDIFVKRPATTIAFILFFIVLGCVSYFNLGIEDSPKIDFPVVTIVTTYPGASPLEVESQAVQKMEEVIAELSDIKNLSSRCYDSFGFIFVEFNIGVDVNTKAIEVKDKVEAILNDLPATIEKPIIQKFDPFSKPIIDLVLSSDKRDTKELFRFADKVLKPKFNAISGVSTLEIFGGKEKEIRVKLDPILMKKYYISIGSVVDGLKMKNLNMPSGAIDAFDQSINVRFLGEFKSLDDIRNTPINSQDGEAIPLKEFAVVEDSYKKVQTISRYKGKEIVSLSVKIVSDANSVQVARAVYKKMPSIKELLKDDMNLFIANDNTKDIVGETNATVENIIVGIILTIIILFLFTGNIPITFIASIVIPTSIISSFLPVDFSHFTINSMTLLAVGTALGTLIANAIVIIENILVHLDKGEDRITASINGTKEVFVAVLASAGTNIVVFTPIAFMGGIIGQFMKQFGMTVVYTTLFSIIASFTLTPMLCAIMLKNKSEQPKKKFFLIRVIDWVVDFLIREYKIIFDLMLKFHYLTLIFSLLILVGSVTLVKYIGNEFIPTYDRDKISVSIVLPQGSSLEKTRKKVEEIEAIIKQKEEIVDFTSTVGGKQGVETAEISINLTPKNIRVKKSDLDIINDWIPIFAKIPDVEVTLGRGISMGGSSGDLTIDLYGHDYDVMDSYQQQIIKKMEESGYFRSVKTSYKKPKKEINFVSDQKQLLNYDVANASLGSMIRTAIYGDETNFYREKGDEYKIRVELNDNYKTSIKDLNHLFMITQKGLVPILELGKFVEDKAIPTIYRRNYERIISIDGFLSKSSAGQVQKYLTENVFKDINFEDGYGYRFSGNSEHQAESGQEIVKAFIIAAILTYMLLVAIMNSFTMPFVIATTIITSFAGVFLLLFFTGASINIASMLAMVMLVGLVVNNAILVLDSADTELAKGAELREAMWIGFSSKFKAVLMTSIAIIAGTWPQLWSNDGMKVSMGAVMIGGMLGSMFFTFFMIPVLYFYAEEVLMFFSKIWKLLFAKKQEN